MSSRYMLFAPVAAYILLLLFFAGLVLLPAMLLVKGGGASSISEYLGSIQSNSYSIILIGLFIALGIVVAHFAAYQKWKNSFLQVFSEGIVLFGLMIPWKYLEMRERNSGLLFHVTDQSEVDLSRIPWPFSSTKGTLGYRIVHYTRGEIFLPPWFFERPITEVLSSLESAQPSSTSQFVAEKAKAKAKGREVSKRDAFMVGGLLSAGLGAYAVFLLVQEGEKVFFTAGIFVVLILAYWFAVLSTYKK